MPEETTTQVEQTAPETKVEAKPEVKEYKGRMVSDMFTRAKKKEEPKKEEAKAEPKSEEPKTEKVEAKTEAKAESKPEKKTLKPLQKKEKEQVDLKELVTSVVEATAKAVKPKEPKKEESDTLPEVPDSRKSELQKIFMAEKNGATHKGATEQAAQLFRAEKDYIDNWQKENPGRRFNADADEHDSFYERNLPDWVESAVESGKSISERESLKKELLKDIEKDKIEPLSKELESLRMEKKFQEAVQQSIPRINSGIKSIAEAIDESLVKVLESGKSAEEHDPLAHAILSVAGPALSEKLVEAAKIWNTGGKAFNADNPSHKFIEQTHNSLVGAKDVDGLTLVPEWEYSQMPADKKRDHRPIDSDVISEAIIQSEAQLAANAYKVENDKMEKMAKARGWHKNGLSAKSDKTEGYKSDESDEEEVSKPRSPSTASRTTINPGAKVEAKVDTKAKDRLVGDMFRR